MLVTIIVDASWCDQTKAAGYGAWIKSERSGVAIGGSLTPGLSDSGLAEMSAVLESIQTSIKEQLVMAGDFLLIQTDNMEAVKLFDRYPSSIDSERNENINSIIRSINKLRFDHDLQIKMRHVKGHTNKPDTRSRANRHCDAQAKHYMKQQRNIIMEQQK